MMHLRDKMQRNLSKSKVLRTDSGTMSAQQEKATQPREPGVPSPTYRVESFNDGGCS